MPVDQPNVGKGLKQNVEHDLHQRDGEPASGAEMIAEAKGGMRAVFPEDVEPVGIAKARLVPIGRGEDRRDRRALRRATPVSEAGALIGERALCGEVAIAGPQALAVG